MDRVLLHHLERISYNFLFFYRKFVSFFFPVGVIILETPMPLKDSNDESAMNTKQTANKQVRKKRVNKKKQINEIPENITFEETSANV